MNLKSTIPILSALLLAFALQGCAAPDNGVPFLVKSNPLGCNVEVNGVFMGTTPTTIQLGVTKRWVGILQSKDGWGYGNESYVVTCLPPPNGSEGLTSQQRTVSPGMTPHGGELFFDLKLDAVTPVSRQQVVIIQKPDHAPEPQKESTGDLSKKLKELESLKQQKLISEDEYKALRAKILSEVH